MNCRLGRWPWQVSFYRELTYNCPYGMRCSEIKVWALWIGFKKDDMKLLDTTIAVPMCLIFRSSDTRRNEGKTGKLDSWTREADSYKRRGEIVKMIVVLFTSITNQGHSFVWNVLFSYLILFSYGGSQVRQVRKGEEKRETNHKTGFSFV